VAERLAAILSDHCCIMSKPVAGQYDIVIPPVWFFMRPADFCDQYGALLIFDGSDEQDFGSALVGPQQKYAVAPDLHA